MTEQTEDQRLKQLWKVSTGGWGTWRSQGSSNSANKILSFILTLILILHSTEEYLYSF